MQGCHHPSYLKVWWEVSHQGVSHLHFCKKGVKLLSMFIHTVVYVFLDAATLTEVFPCIFLSCKANARV